MSEPMDRPGDASPASREFMVQVGKTRLTGLKALVAVLVLLGTLTMLLIWTRASLRMILSGAIWLGFTIYWGVAAGRAAPTERAESEASRAVHRRLMNAAFLLLFVPVPGLRARLLPLDTVVVISGFAVQSLFLILAVWSRRHLGQYWSARIAVARDHRLIRSGPYGRIRHPIYTAIIGMFAGTAIICGELHSLLAVLLITGAYVRKLRLEEQNLRDIFGPEYDEYRRHTAALIPFVI